MSRKNCCITSLLELTAVYLLFQNIFIQAVVLRQPLKLFRSHVQARSVTTNLSDVNITYQHNNLHGKSGQGYYLEAYIGTPPQKLNILVDTGSSNFAIAAYPDPVVTRYFHTNQSSTYKEEGTEVSVPYTQGIWQGVLGTDVVSLPSLPNATVKPVIAFITKSDNFFINASDWQGILGLAYAEIARPDKSVTPFLDTLFHSINIPDIFAMQLCGSGNFSDDDISGSMTIGGVDEDLYKGEIFYTPIYKKWYYEVVLASIQVSGQSLAIDCKEYNFDKTIVDSGTTNLRLPHKVFEALVAKLKESVTLSDVIKETFWTNDDQLCWTEGFLPFSNFPTLSLHLVRDNNSTFQLEVLPQQYIRPVSEQKDIPGQDCFKFAITSSDSGSVIGAVIMEGYYVVFDRQNNQIGFAESTCQVWEQTLEGPKVSGPFPYAGNITECAYKKPKVDDSMLLIVAYIMAGICAICILPLLIMLVHWFKRKFFNKTPTTDDSVHGLVSDDR